jgi:hypothetical protein
VTPIASILWLDKNTLDPMDVDDEGKSASGSSSDSEEGGRVNDRGKSASDSSSDSEEGGRVGKSASDSPSDSEEDGRVKFPPFSRSYSNIRQIVWTLMGLPSVSQSCLSILLLF